MITYAQMLQFAYRYGHQWNPDFPNLANLKKADLAKLTENDRLAKDLVHSWQTFDYNVILQSLYFGHGEPEAEGKIGPATEMVVAYNRCPLPDFPPPPGATFDTGIPGLNKAITTQQEAAKEFAVGQAFVGSYWKGCNPKHPDIHSLRVGYRTSRAPSVWVANRDKILAAQIAAAAEIGISVEYFLDPAPDVEAEMEELIIFEGLAGSVIGWNEFPPSNSCARIDGRLDSGYNPSNWLTHANLGVHEHIGHGIGLNHTRGGIMNPSIITIDPLTYKGDPAWSQITRYYPAVPLPTQPPTNPPSDPGVNLILKVTQSGIIDAVAKRAFTATPGQVLGKFTITPAVG